MQHMYRISSMVVARISIPHYVAVRACALVHRQVLLQTDVYQSLIIDGSENFFIKEKVKINIIILQQPLGFGNFYVLN